MKKPMLDKVSFEGDPRIFWQVRQEVTEYITLYVLVEYTDGEQRDVIFSATIEFAPDKSRWAIVSDQEAAQIALTFGESETEKGYTTIGFADAKKKFGLDICQMVDDIIMKWQFIVNFVFEMDTLEAGKGARRG